MLTSNLSLGLIYNFNDFAVEELFRPIIKNFLSYQNNAATSFIVLGADEYITSYDFKRSSKVPIKYIYLNILNNIEKNNGVLDIPVGIFITLDKNQCPNYCSHSNRYYSTISIGGVDKVFYILLSTDEIFDFLYNKETGGDIEYLKVKDSKSTNIENTNSIKISVDTKKPIVDYIKGYVDNHNLIKGLSFISISNKDGYPIYHRDFPDIVNIEVGSIIELEISNAYALGKVIDYKLTDLQEIEGLIQSFTGILSKINSVAFISPDLEDMSTIFVPPSLAKNFEDSKFIKVLCLARNKKPLEKNQYEWSALRVIKNK